MEVVVCCGQEKKRERRNGGRSLLRTGEKEGKERGCNGGEKERRVSGRGGANGRSIARVIAQRSDPVPPPPILLPLLPLPPPLLLFLLQQTTQIFLKNKSQKNLCIEILYIKKNLNSNSNLNRVCKLLTYKLWVYKLQVYKLQMYRNTIYRKYLNSNSNLNQI